MSLLDDPPHEVWIHARPPQEDEYGQALGTVRDENWVGPIRCAVQPYTSGQNNVSGVKIKSYGTQVRVGYTIFYRGEKWPGGPASLIKWNGEIYQQDGEAQHYSMSAATEHYEISMTKQTVPMY